MKTEIFLLQVSAGFNLDILHLGTAFSILGNDLFQMGMGLKSSPKLRVGKCVMGHDMKTSPAILLLIHHIC